MTSTNTPGNPQHVKHPTLGKLHQLKFLDMATALAEQLDATEIEALSFLERFDLRVDRELTSRDDRRMTNRLGRAKLRHNACLEDIDYRHSRSLDKALILSFATCRWLKERINSLQAHRNRQDLAGLRAGASSVP